MDDRRIGLCKYFSWNLKNIPVNLQVGKRKELFPGRHKWPGKIWLNFLYLVTETPEHVFSYIRVLEMEDVLWKQKFGDA